MKLDEIMEISLKSWKGDYLHRPDTAQDVTTWHTGIGNKWTLEPMEGGKHKLKSWKGDYLHRPDTSQGVTTWHTGVGNEWILEILSPPKVAKVVIATINYDGVVKRTESDEYVEITNQGNAVADISGWKMNADDKDQDFVFPQGTTLAPSQSIRVYTNEVHAETGGFSFGSKVAIWNNLKDNGQLFDDKGNLVSEFGYDNSKK